MESPLSHLDAVRKSGDAPTDVTLQTSDGESIGAHSLLICAISPVLRAALSQTSGFQEGASRTINLDYASSDTVEKMLSFACGGFGHPQNVNTGSRSTSGHGYTMEGNDAMELLPLADRLDFAVLKKACESTLESLLTSENASDIWECANASHSMELAAKARKIVDQPETSTVVRNLLDKKRKLVADEKELEEEISKMKKRLQGVQKEAKDAKEQVEFEMNESFRKEAEKAEAATKASASSETAAVEYPHPEGRRLTALPPVNDWGYGVSDAERKRLEQQYEYGSYDLVFDKLNDALEAALPGDVIELSQGTHGPMDPWELDINKSVQIVGAGEGSQLIYNGSDGLISIKGGADVRISSIKFSENAPEGAYKAAVSVTENSRVWFDNCKFDLRGVRDNGLDIGKGCSAYVSRCKFIGGFASAVYVDLKAKAFVMSDSFVTGSGEGQDDGGDEWYSPGECGAIEAASNRGRVNEGESETPSVKIALQRNIIKKCFGPAVSYRRNCMLGSSHWNKSPEMDYFEWPGDAVIEMKDNEIAENGLARPSGSIPDGEVVFHNVHSDNGQREQARMKAMKGRRSY